jgi:hypothetical protein
MGCDIHIFAEKKGDDGKYYALEFIPFDWRSYGMFGFLAGVRNYSDVTPISGPRGMPADASDKALKGYDSLGSDGHSHSWLTVYELTSFDYDATMEDRRVTRQTGPNSWSGGCTCEPGEGKQMTWREFLGEGFFADLEKLQDLGADRIVFWFDN